jgi:hypothetical protein
MRDPSICIGPGGTYYLTGTTANNPAGSHDKTGWYYVNEGIRLWKSKDLKKWEPLGLVWSLDKDATWAKEFKPFRDARGRAVWAPEIHYLKGTFWLSYGMNYRGAGLLKSTTGKPEGPYVDINPDGPFFGSDGKDVSLFQDDDGKVYLVYNKGWIAPLNEDMTGLAGKPRLLKPANARCVGFEGAFLTKHKGKYILMGAEFNEYDGGRTYDCMAAVADNLYGPYGDRYLAIPHAGHNILFRTREGQWMSTFFGTPHDARAIFTEKPAILPIEFDADGRFRPLMRTSARPSASGVSGGEWKPAKGPLLTRWAQDVQSDNVWPEYPRPQMVRNEWLNLNGLWDFSLLDKDKPRPSDYAQQILVPFPVESALSGVCQTVTEKQRLWYRRTFEIPKAWGNQRVLLNFGAVDWQTTVWVNNVEIGAHKGGFDAFSFDITDALSTNGPQEIVISVWDPSDAGQQPHGKQFRIPPSATRYTAASGIWQTVWLEPVQPLSIKSLKITPDIDKQTVRIELQGSEPLSNCMVKAVIKENDSIKTTQTSRADQPLVMPVKNPLLWSPDSPFLYDVELVLKESSGKVVDRISSYFGMRKIDVATASDGYKRIRLNNTFLSQLGFLDQGYWPDGIYTAPTDEALRYDIEAVKKVGCNMVRKHVKIEPQRWYYWCDKLGLLVWQDMVNGKQSEEGRSQYKHELKLMIEQHYNHPSIVMWIPFNEGWGQFDTSQIHGFIKELDSTRLVNASSGGIRAKDFYGDIYDMHNYPGPAAPVAEPYESEMVSVLGEFGGLGLWVKNHAWHKLDERRLRGFSAYHEKRTEPMQIEKTHWGTGWVIPLKLEESALRDDWKHWDKQTYIDEYGGLYGFIPQLRDEKGLDVAVYTQLTDVEDELNGILTYDRVFKAEPAQFANIHKQSLRQQQPSLQIENGRLEVTIKNQTYQVQLRADETVELFQPAEGLWSVAMDFQNDWPAQWCHGSVDTVERKGPWLVLSGTIKTETGNWQVRDAYIAEGQRIRCVRRWQWTGEKPAENITLSVRWQVPIPGASVMMPGFCIYGNPSGNADRVAQYAGKPGEEVFCEEHRLSMPFISLEWEKWQQCAGAALHMLPSLAPYAHKADLWWSAGVTGHKNSTELALLSGPCSLNGQRGFVKANQRKWFAYTDTYLTIPSGGVVEKTFYLQAYRVKHKGSGFRIPLRESLDIFRPFNTAGLPSMNEIVEAKYRFAMTRWHENAESAGFKKYPDRNVFVMGWAGQAAVPGYALLVLGEQKNDQHTISKAQKSLDHLTTSPFNEYGFLVSYDPDKNGWSQQDPVSQGHAMETFARAILTGRKIKTVDTSKWEAFLRNACDIHAERILGKDWRPKSTNEAFLVSPLCKAYKMFGSETYRDAALKAAEHYAQRHLDMTEPYWGGTLDASCEDKEGAWAGFQAFLAVYEMTEDSKYLQWAEHAMDVTLSYTVIWDIDMPAGRLRDHDLKTRGWTDVSAQNQHLDVYGVVYTPEIYRMGQYLQREDLKKLAIVMYRSCGQLIDPNGSQGEQLNHTNFAQMRPPVKDVHTMRGTYNEGWTVFWITAHFLNAAAQFEEMGVYSDTF